MEQVPVVEIAKALYAKSVIVPQWDKEQQSLQHRWFDEAERLLKVLNESGFWVVVAPKSEAPAPEPVVIPRADVDEFVEGFKLPGDEPEKTRRHR